MKSEELPKERTNDETEKTFDHEVAEFGVDFYKKQNNKLIEALEGLITNPHISLGDLVYAVRDSEGKGWEGEYVKKWSESVTNAEKLLKQHGSK